MKRRLQTVLWILFLVMLWILPEKSLAKVNLSTTNKEVEKGQVFHVSLQIEEPVASYTTSLYFDSDKLQFESGPEALSYTENEIRYVWYEGQEKPNFAFRAKEKGTTQIGIKGQFYDDTGKRLNLTQQGLEIKVNQKEQQQEGQIEEEVTVDSSNSKLKTLRINYEGMTPTFKPDVYDYYFVTQEEIDNLEIEVNSENSSSTITIIGNENLKQGQNKITIKVKSPSGEESEYRIWATKTKQIEKTNTNLETLAIEYGELQPAFSNEMTHYTVVMPTDVAQANILAVPEDMAAKVEIQGKKDLQYGNNTFTIVVTAADHSTTKKYVLTVYRRNEQEEIEAKQQQEVEAEKLATVLDTKDEQAQWNEEEVIKASLLEQNKNQILWIIGIIILIAIASIFVYQYKKKQKKNNNQNKKQKKKKEEK